MRTLGKNPTSGRASGSKRTAVDLEDRDPLRDVALDLDDSDDKDVPERDLVQADRPAGIAAHDVPAILRWQTYQHQPEERPARQRQVTYSQSQHPLQQIAAHNIEQVHLRKSLLNLRDVVWQLEAARPRRVPRPLFPPPKPSSALCRSRGGRLGGGTRKQLTWLCKRTLSSS